MLGQHLRIRLGDLRLQATQRVTDAFLRLHFSQQVQPHRNQLAGAEKVFGVVFLDGVSRLDQVVGKDLQTEGELGKFFDRVGTMPDGRAEHGPDLDVLFVSHRGDEMSDPGLTDPDGFLAALEEIGIVVERAGLACLQQAAVAWVVLNRRERMRVEVEHLEPQPGRRRKPVHHPGELRTADQRAKLPFLRFYLYFFWLRRARMSTLFPYTPLNSGSLVVLP